MLMVLITQWSIESQPNYQSLGCLQYINVLNEMPILGIYVDQKEFRWKVEGEHIKTMFL